jgi:hypothetical protein
LAQAKTRRDSFRERDLRRHLKNQEQEDKADAKEAAKDDDTPTKFNPKDDDQVKQAVNYLKSFEFFKKVGHSQPQNGSG